MVKNASLLIWAMIYAWLYSQEEIKEGDGLLKTARGDEQNAVYLISWGIYDMYMYSIGVYICVCVPVCVYAYVYTVCIHTYAQRFHGIKKITLLVLLLGLPF